MATLASYASADEATVALKSVADDDPFGGDYVDVRWLRCGPGRSYVSGGK
ncbi:hypothetical protein ACFYPC_13355 [Streptomyces sp. NPDC005808]